LNFIAAMEIVAQKKLFWFLKEGTRFDLSNKGHRDMYIQQVLSRGKTADVQELFRIIEASDFQESFGRIRNFLPKEVKRLWEEWLGDTHPHSEKRTHLPDLSCGQGVFMRNQKRIKKNAVEASFVDKIISLFADSIVKVILFGSRAKGIPKPESDYDFLVVLKKKDRRTLEGIYEVVTDFLLEYGVDISLKIYSLEEYQKMNAIPTPFMASIIKTGREMWTPKTSL